MFPSRLHGYTIRSFYRASSGSGLELARLLYLDGFSLILISRSDLKTFNPASKFTSARCRLQVLSFIATGWCIHPSIHPSIHPFIHIGAHVSACNMGFWLLSQPKSKRCTFRLCTEVEGMERVWEWGKKNEKGITNVCLSVCRYVSSCVRKIEGWCDGASRDGDLKLRQKWLPDVFYST